MINDLFRRLGGVTPAEPLSPIDSRLALATLMVRLARSDGSYSARESGRIDRVLTDRYGLDDRAVASLRAEAEAIEADAPDTVRFTRMIKDAVPHEDRDAVVEALWKVAAADGINADEHGFLRLVTSLVGVEDQDSGLARQRALRDAPD